jgi:upstream activation factor subunit UAF30
MANRIHTVPAEQRASYAAIIDEILSTADLETISAKRIRNALQERVDYDLSGQKVCGVGRVIASIC